MLQMYLLSISEAERIPTQLCEKLFPNRMERSRRFRNNSDALRCIAAGVLTAFVLGVKEDEISFNQWGKPFLKDKKYGFSLSHSGDYALLAVADGDVGADIEKHTPIHRDVAQRVFTERELRWMDEAPQTRFFELWTTKESVMKLDGRGFSLSPESFCVLELMNGRTVTFDCGTVYGMRRTFDGYTLSVCANSPIEDIQIKILSLSDLWKNINNFPG